MFEIKCLKCGKTVKFNDGVNDESKISIWGEIESLWDAKVYFECKCGNEIAIEKAK